MHDVTVFGVSVCGVNRGALDVLCHRVRWDGLCGDSGAEFGLDALRDFAHVGSPLKLRLQFTHQLAHCRHASCLDTCQRLIDECVDIVS